MPVDLPLTRYEDIQIANQGNLSGVFNLREARSGLLAIGSTMTGTSLTFQGAESADGTFFTLRDATSGAAITANITNAPCLVPIPSGVLGLPFAKVLSNGTEAAARSIRVITKS